MKKILLSININGENNAGSKAKNDIDFFLEKDDFNKVNLDLKDINNINNNGKKRLNFLNENDVNIVAIQYGGIPLPYVYKLIKSLKINFKVRIILFIHDVEALRSFSKRNAINFLKTKFEIHIFNMSDVLIVHNVFMKKKLANLGIKKPMISIDLFDYKNNVPLKNNFEKKYNILFAGELSKSEFLSKIKDMHYLLHVFGPNPRSSYSSCIKYEGQYNSEILPQYLTGSFGLVWDGVSINTCEGMVGNYLKFNNPHKTSLYLSCGIPVISWKKAAISSFIERERVGFTVESLNDLDKKLDNITAQKYLELQNNCMDVAQKVRSGFYTLTATRKAMQIILSLI